MLFRKHRAEIDFANLRRVTATSAVALAATQAVTAAVALPRRRRDYVDVIWGPGLAEVAIVGALVGRGDARRRWATAALTTAWAARLGNLIRGRIATSDEEDPRYSEYLGDAGVIEVVGKVFLTQGLAQLIVSAPIQLSAASRLSDDARRRRLLPLGLAVAVAGTVVEALADHQKDVYRDLPKDEKPQVLDSGLWGWSRHPNYFGDSLVWDGIWLTSAASTGAWATLPAPVAMSYLLIVATGARRTETRMQERPGYRDYQRRVSFFFPRPPKD